MNLPFKEAYWMPLLSRDSEYSPYSFSVQNDDAKMEIHPAILKRHPEQITADLAF